MIESLFYLPPSEDSTVAARIKETYGFPIRNMVKFLTDFFEALRKEQHHIYVLLENLPLEDFVIERTYDRQRYWNNRSSSEDLGHLHPRERYTLHEFLENVKRFHRLDWFEVVALGQRFTEGREGVLCQRDLIQQYHIFLRRRCKLAMRQNDPIRITRAISRQYGLSDEDMRYLSPKVNKYNRRAKYELWMEYEELAGLDCIREMIEVEKQRKRDGSVPNNTARP